MPGDELAEVLKRIRNCTLCSAHLPLGPRPVVVASSSARILIIGQAPGTRVHETGIPWNDPSGDRLRSWMNVDREKFYDAACIAIMPMGFCYPGRLAAGGDAPPRAECAPQWHDELRGRLPAIRLTLLVGGYAQVWYREGKKRSVTETVGDYRARMPGILALPHPSWRSSNWLQKNPWFETDVVPILRQRVVEEMKTV